MAAADKEKPRSDEERGLFD